MQSRATREAVNANTEALKEATRVAREATEMMRAILHGNPEYSAEPGDVKFDGVGTR